jgi:hypothetical protein
VPGCRGRLAIVGTGPQCLAQMRSISEWSSSQIGLFTPVARHAGSNQAILARLQAADSLAAFLERAQIFKLFEELHGVCFGQAMP